MDQQQKDQALGLLIAKMFGGMATSKNPTTLGALNEGLSGGIDSFQKERANIAALNAYEIDRQDRLEREKQARIERDRERNELNSYRREMLDYKRSGSSSTSSKNPYYGLPAEAKLMLQQQEIDEGFLPGSNKTIELTPQQQERYSELTELKMQKNATDADTRRRAIFAENLVKAINNTNIDDLTRYSGPAGQARLKVEEAKDLAGNPTDNYLKYKEALTAVQIEAKELRQALGESITPAMAAQLQHLTNPTGFFISPKVAKAQIQKTRDLIQKQMDTFRSRLKRTSQREPSEGSPRLNEYDEKIYRAKQAGYTDEEIDAIMQEQ
jgi:hypothetical protein